MDYSCCFSLGGNLDLLDFLQKKFYNIDYWSWKINTHRNPNKMFCFEA